MGRKSLLYGVGVNDADYAVEARCGAVRYRCPFYVKWSSMIQRCYSKIYKMKTSAYEGCTVCKEWLIFSNFKSWMEEQDWQGKELDKDLLVVGNKVYSPETCAFVDLITNIFTTDSRARRGEWPIGASWCKKDYVFTSRCSNPFTKKKEHLGHFHDAQSAHLAWKKRKHELACMLANLQTNERVADALKSRYL